MKNFACLLALLFACSKSEAPAPASTPSPAPAVAPPAKVAAPVVTPTVAPVQFLVWNEDTVRFLTATSTVTENRQVKLSSDERIVSINQVVWIAGQDPIVRFDENRIGRITQNGFEELPAVPASKWRSKAPRDLEEVTEEWSLTVTKSGAFLGNCRFGSKGMDDRDECSHWEHMRVFPGKLVKQAPEVEPPAELPEVKPTRTTTSSFEVEHATILRCTRDGKTVEIPAADHANRAYGVGTPEWISAEPAIFKLTEYSEGDPTSESTAIYVDCASTTYRDAVRGPHGIVALLGDGLAAMEGGPNPTDTVSSIRRDGREIGTVREGHLVFAP